MDESIAESTKTIINAIASVPDKLYADSADPLASIVPEAVNQNQQSGVCVPLSVFSSLAYGSRRKEITQWIKPVENGQVSVHLPGSSKQFVFDKPSLAHSTMFNTGAQFGYWSSLLLRAFTQELPCKTKQCTTLETAIPEYRLTISVGMERPAEAIEKITGNKAYQLPLAEIRNPHSLERTIKNALANERVIVAAIKSKSSFSQEGNLARNHAHSVFKLEGSYITLRDPMGENAIAGKAGYIKLPLREFSKKFNVLAIETSPPLKR